MGLKDRVFIGQQEDSLDPLVDRIVFNVSSVVSERRRFHDGRKDVLVLGVRVYEPDSDSSKVPINTLLFEGNSPVISGMLIRARIPRCDQSGALMLSYTQHEDSPRDYLQEESAIQLELLSSDQLVTDIRILRTDRSANYDDYVNHFS